MATYYLGLSVTYHDSALAIVSDEGEVLFAEATERFLQNKRALNCEPDQLLQIPELLQQYCPNPDQIVIATNWLKKRPFYENVVNRMGILSASGILNSGIKKLHSPLSNYQIHHMMACQRSSIETAGLNLVRIFKEYYPNFKVVFKDYDHHLSHASIACYGSPFKDSACAVMDSYGEKGAMAFYRYRHRKLELLHEAKGLSKASLGLYYMKITELCGFDWLKGEEWKVMGLASYGKLNPQLYDVLSSIIAVNGFECTHPAQHFFKHLEKLNSFKRDPESHLEEAADVAYTGQLFFAELAAKLLNHLHNVTQCENLTLAGGCALNSSFNGQITERTPFKQAFVPSAPADDGCALGAAWLAYHEDIPAQLSVPKPQSPYLGSSFKHDTLKRFIRFNRSLDVRHLPDSLCQETARLLSAGRLIGWVQGRAEFGPRALGNRSILADPRYAATQDLINDQVKFREMFRPFAPSILAEYAEAYFDNYQESPYMDKTLSIRENMRNNIAAVCHVDGTGRLQTVKQTGNPRFYELIHEFYQLTGIPVLLNTSFNVMGKPLVHCLEDALAVFMTTGLDALVVNDYLITKPRDE